MGMFITVSVLLGLPYLGLILFYTYHWRKLPIMQSPPEQWEPVTPISVIVPARNEEHHIEACLQGIVAQRYPAHLLQ
ncbi:MAG TPA: glycosyl hydrolase, partial [Phnomibacter sp.]|nr:glycosyl hydrolase [Phnomibacter sp.]